MIVEETTLGFDRYVLCCCVASAPDGQRLSEVDMLEREFYLQTIRL